MYLKWKDSTPIIISKKLQVLRIAKETQAQTRLREMQVLSNYKFEIEKLKIVTDRQLQKNKSCHENMTAFINLKCTGETRTKLVKDK